MDEDIQSDQIIKSLTIVNGILDQQNIFQIDKYLAFEDLGIRKIVIQAIVKVDGTLEYRVILFDLWKNDRSSDIRNDVYFILSERYGFTAEHFDL